MASIATEGPRRARLFVSDTLVGLRMARHRIARRMEVEGKVIETMPSREQVEAALRIFRACFDMPSEVRVVRRVARAFPWAAVVLRGGGTVEGYSFFRILPGRRAILLSMAVADENRGRGYGRAMLSFGLSILKEAGMESVDLDVEEGNEAAIRLYSELGFSRQGGTPARRMIRMRKALTR